MILHLLPLTSQRWSEFEELFGARGACGGCWCMYWRETAKEFSANKGNGNRKAMLSIINNNVIPGLIGYLEERPVAWIAIAPRDDTPRLENSRILARIDEKPVWSITCFFISKEFRNKGLSQQMIEGACEWAFERGAEIVEAYPYDLPKGERQPDPFVYTGIASPFRKTGFVEIARRSAKRPVMRKTRG